MDMYYLARVKVATDNGRKITWKKEAYLVSAVSVTDAEVKVNAAYERIINHFPYDGNAEELEIFLNSQV